MTKQETIQNAYGKDWEIIKNFVNNDGWFNGIPTDNESSRVFNKIYNDCDVRHNHIRLKSLKGIEHNNGWILTAEKGIPIENGDYHIINTDNEMWKFKFDKDDRFNVATWLTNVTHYQPAIIPKPPIY